MDIFFVVFVTLLVPLAFNSVGHAAQLRQQTARLARVERKLDAILNHLGVEPDDRDGLSAEARRYADGNQKIAAIKQHREDTGAGLAEAKAVVEEYLSRAAQRG
jgi:ribosomal protein L7/L12